MSENAVSQGIVSTASILTTVLIIGAAFAVAFGVGNAIRDTGESLADQINTDLEVINIGNSSTGDDYLYVFVKNTGEQSIPSFQYVDVYLDGEFFVYLSTDLDTDRWNATLLSDYDADTYWGPLETIKITLNFSSGQTLGAGSHRLIISLSGDVDEYRFSV